MTLSQVSAKIDLRLNKSASADYDNIWSYAKEEAFNKAVIEWVRRQKHGKNQTQEGDEETDMRVDDLQFLLVSPKSLNIRNKGQYVQTDRLPSDYMYFKRLTPYVSKGMCTGVQMQSHLKEEANVDALRSFPSFEFEETFHTIINNKIHLYHNNQFTVDNVYLVYYRRPKIYNFKKLDTILEFGDSIAELIVDEACKIIASDIQDINSKTLAQERSEFNN